MAIKIRLLRITAEGEYDEVPFKPNQLKSDQVFLLVNEADKDIWIWKGKDARVRKKFLGARAATELRNDIGFQYKVHSIDEGDSNPDFQALIENAEPTTKPLSVAEAEKPLPPRTKRKSKTRPKKAKTVDPAAYKQLTDIVPTPTLKSRKNTVESKKPSKTLIEDKVETKTTTKVEKSKPVSPATISALEIPVKSVMNKLEEIEPLDGYFRELVIIGHACYGVSEKSVKFLGEERVEKNLELIKNMPEGIFFAEEYTPRVVVEDGKVIAVEFWKESQLASEQLKSSMTRSLDELTKFFRMIEEGEPEES